MRLIEVEFQPLGCLCDTAHGRRKKLKELPELLGVKCYFRGDLRHRGFSRRYLFKGESHVLASSSERSNIRREILSGLFPSQYCLGHQIGVMRGLISARIVVVHDGGETGGHVLSVR